MTRFLILLFLTSFETTTEELDIARLVGKDHSEIEAYVGKPSRVETFTPQGQVCTCERTVYLEGRLSVMYVDGYSDWIWIDNAVRLLNLNNARYWAYHKFLDHHLIRVKQRAGNTCCIGLP